LRDHTLGWFGIVRLGLVQTALGAIVVLSTSTVNRLMIVELALPALVPGFLVTWHYALQILRPRWGHGSDTGGRRTPWILGGLCVLALGGLLSALSVPVMATNPILGLGLAFIAFSLIGMGVGAAGTTLLVLLATSVARERRAAAATIVWIMMIAGFVITAAIIGKTLAPYSAEKLITIAASICGGALLLAFIAVYGLERSIAPATVTDEAHAIPFRDALADAWRDETARRFTIFVFVSMLAYSAQELVLEPFAALVFKMPPNESALIAGAQHGGALAGMILVGTVATLWGRSRLSVLRLWIMIGCVGSAIAVTGLVFASRFGIGFPLRETVFGLGFANGIYAVAAIGSMFTLSESAGRAGEGIRMGLFGAAQGIAFGIGGLGGSSLSDLARFVFGSPELAYGSVFSVEAALFLASALLALSIGRSPSHVRAPSDLVLATDSRRP